MVKIAKSGLLKILMVGAFLILLTSAFRAFGKTDSSPLAFPISYEVRLPDSNALESSISYSNVVAQAGIDNVTNVVDPTSNDNNLAPLPVNPTIVNPDIVKDIENTTEKQKISVEKTEEAMRQIENTEIKSFLLGTNVGMLRFQVIQMKDEIYHLKTLLSQTENYSEKTTISGQIQYGEQEQVKVENFINQQKSKFSLFGWFMNLL